MNGNLRPPMSWKTYKRKLDCITKRCYMNYPKNIISNLALAAIALLSVQSCVNFDTGIDNPSACENEYYSELLGNYQGRIKADLWETEEHVNHRNSCEWDVSLTLRSDESGTGQDVCGLRTDVLFTLLSQQNTDNGDYFCVEEPEGWTYYVHDDYLEEVEFQKAPQWPISYYSTTTQVFHSATTYPTSNPGQFMTPMTGTSASTRNELGVEGSAFIFEKLLNGNIEFVRGADKNKENYFPAKVVEITLTGSLIKQ